MRVYVCVILNVYAQVHNDVYVRLSQAMYK